MLALSSRPWLGYSDQGKFNLVPMSYEALDYASGGWRRCRHGRGPIAAACVHVGMAGGEAHGRLGRCVALCVCLCVML